jgi:hypothetical protein
MFYALTARSVRLPYLEVQLQGAPLSSFPHAAFKLKVARVEARESTISQDWISLKCDASTTVRTSSGGGAHSCERRQIATTSAIKI